MARYSKEYRENAIRLCESRGGNVAEIARELGLKYQTLYNWCWKARNPDGVSGGGRPREVELETKDDELKRLRRENKRLEEDLEIAKKAAAFFARHQR
jgi:transposase